MREWEQCSDAGGVALRAYGFPPEDSVEVLLIKGTGLWLPWVKVRGQIIRGERALPLEQAKAEAVAMHQTQARYLGRLREEASP